MIMVIKMQIDKIYTRAQEKVNEKIKFYRHMFSYMTTILLLFVVNYICTPEYWWVLWVAFFWGIGVLLNFLKVYVIYDKFDEVYRERMIEEEINKMKN